MFVCLFFILFSWWVIFFIKKKKKKNVSVKSKSNHEVSQKHNEFFCFCILNIIEKQTGIKSIKQNTCNLIWIVLKMFNAWCVRKINQACGHFHHGVDGWKIEITKKRH